MPVKGLIHYAPYCRGPDVPSDFIVNKEQP
jgi:hypothetical protein